MHPIPSSLYTKAALLCAMLIISCPRKNYCSFTFKIWHFGGGHRPQFTSSLRRKLIKSERFYSTYIITTSALDDRKLIQTTSVSKKDQLCTSGRPVRRNLMNNMLILFSYPLMRSCFRTRGCGSERTSVCVPFIFLFLLFLCSSSFALFCFVFFFFTFFSINLCVHFKNISKFWPDLM